MAGKIAAPTLPDTYFKLVRRFPLIHIRDDQHLRAAQKMLDWLLEQNRDEGEEEYLDALVDLVETYERDHQPIPDASGADVLRELMGTNRLSQGKLANAVGISQSTISAVLNGKRSLTMEQVITLSKFFHVPSVVFLPAP